MTGGLEAWPRIGGSKMAWLWQIMAEESQAAKSAEPPPGAGKALLRASAKGDMRALARLIWQRADVNVTDPKSGSTPLHYAAAFGSRPALRLLLKASDLDVLIRDRQGRLASELAGVYGHDPAMARLLLMKEGKQARERGLPPPKRREKRG